MRLSKAQFVALCAVAVVMLSVGIMSAVQLDQPGAASEGLYRGVSIGAAGALLGAALAVYSLVDMARARRTST